MTTTLRDAALAHAKRGRPVFPCNPSADQDKGKKPLTEHGFKDATTDAEQINLWWTKWPNALIGMPTGAISKCFVLDIDVDETKGKNGEESLSKLINGHGKLPDTVEAMTPRGGRHIYFKHPGGAIIQNSTSKIGKDLDIRGDGGYVILPPSRLENGKQYDWEGSSSPDDGVKAVYAPQWFMDLLLVPTAPAPTPASQHDGDAAIEDGRRNDTLFRLGRSLRAKGLGDAAITAALLEENQAKCSPPLPDAEVRQLAGSACTKPPGKSGPAPAGTTATVTDINTARKPKPAPSSQAFSDSDDDLATLFVDQNPDMRYVAKWGRWLHWNGHVWAHDDMLTVLSMAREMMRLFAASAEDDKQRRRLLAEARINAVASLARSDRRTASSVDQWDQDDLILNTPSGLIDLQTGEVRPHRPEAHCSKITAHGVGAAGQPKPACDLWIKFLLRVCGGDKDLMRFLQRVIGYCATGLTREHAMFFCYGTGANGKGTFLNLLCYVLHAYAVVAPMDVFIESSQERHPTELAMMASKRVVVAQETEEGRKWAESKVKAMTGGDPITARFMGKDFFTFMPKFKLLIAGNHKPALRNIDEAIRRRFHLIPFTVTVPKEDRDPELFEKLKAEAEGIMQWIVNGAVEYFRMGLAPPACVVEATRQYFEDEDVMSDWLTECCDKGADYWEPTGLMFASWKAYAEKANIRVGDAKALSGKLVSAGFEPKRASSRGGRYWAGVKLKPVEVKEDPRYGRS